MTEACSSPEHLRTSLAAAMVLGAAPGRFYRDVKLHCINLLLTYPEGCRANCAYCGLARGRPGEYGDKSFIRVDWPILPTEEVIERMARYRDSVKRVCLSMVTHRRAYEDTLAISQQIRDRVGAPLSGLIAPNLFDRSRLAELKEAGVDTIGIGLDAASEAVFERTRGKSVNGPLAWGQYWQIVEEARDIYGPWRVNCHIVLGIGERDGDLIALFQRLKGMQVAAYLFSFYPEAGSPMARRQRPSVMRVRRVQLVKHLLERGLMKAEQVCLDERGYIKCLDVPLKVVEGAIESGLPFMTGGCPGEDGALACTRPFGSYRPGEAFRDYPFLPEGEDIREIKRQLRLPSLVGERA